MNLKRFVPRVSKKVFIVLAAVIATIGVVGTVSAWYPERPTYTIEKPADHVTFNSITNNPNEGDERAFFEVKDAANTQMNGFSGRAEVKEGQELLLRVYVHNNAASNLNGQNLDGKGVAKNSKVRIHLPTDTAQALRANAYVSADNAQPQTVADTIDMVGASGSNFSVEYIPGSAIQYTNAVPSGMKLSDSIVTTGAPIGYNSPNGVIPGCFEYSSIVTVKVRVKTPSYSIQKSARLEGQTSNDWKESVKANPGQNTEWRIEFKNIGSTELKQVKVVDNIPTGLTVVPGSVKLYNGNYPSGYVYPETAVQAGGKQVNVNIGNYNPGINAFILFTTKVPEKDSLKCGVNKFDNIAYATPDGFGAVNDGASVVTDGDECKPDEPVYACDLLDLKTSDGRKVEVTLKYTAKNGAEFKNAIINFGDGKDELVTDQTTTSYTYAQDGTYNISAEVRFSVNGQDKVVTSESCSGQVTFKNDKPVPPVTSVTTTPTTLPNTGVGNLVGIFSAVSVGGALVHRLVSARKNG